MPSSTHSSAKGHVPFDTRIIWAIALPAMLTNVATALIGLGDMWIVGRLEDAATQGAVDLGARVFAVLFTVMNFLKTGTTGLVAQAGARAGKGPSAARTDQSEQHTILLRGLAVGLVIAALLLAFKPLILPALLSALGASGEVRSAAMIYGEIRFWSAPGVMVNLALIGFLIGRRQMKAVLAIEVAYNLLNIGLGLWFVLGLDLGIAGIGWSSVIAEYAKLGAVILFVLRGGKARILASEAMRGDPLSWAGLKPFLSVNRDLFLRTLILMFALALLTRLSAERGAVMLAANGIIYQLFVLTALLLDGFENAAQVLNGERLGARDRTGFIRYIRAIMLRGLAVAGLVAIGFAALGSAILESFAATEAVAMAAKESAIWLVIIPFAGLAGFVYDGVFVGASWTRALLLSMAGAVAIFVLALWLTWPLGNAGLWGSFTVFLVMRAAIQAVMIPRLVQRTF
jgi:MATE family multidrug resistance protein